jgi:hypothetical protein
MSKFKQGDKVTFDDDFIDVTIGKPYEIEAINLSGSIKITDDAGDEHDIDAVYATLYTGAQPSLTTPQAQQQARTVRAIRAGSNLPASISHDDDIAVDEDDYDTRKANRRVTSVGDFEAGVRLVYKDGTPTLTSLTVKCCTATCVWFEETYSAAFDPNEFTVER